MAVSVLFIRSLVGSTFDVRILGYILIGTVVIVILVVPSLATNLVVLLVSEWFIYMACLQLQI